MVTHKDFLLAQLPSNGETAGFTSFDGVSFFNDAQVSGDSGNQDNQYAVAALDTDNPTADKFRITLKSPSRS